MALYARSRGSQVQTAECGCRHDWSWIHPSWRCIFVSQWCVWFSLCSVIDVMLVGLDAQAITPISQYGGYPSVLERLLLMQSPVEAGGNDLGGVVGNTTVA